MMDVSFVIPQTKSDLLNKSHDSFHVRKTFNADALPKLLTEIKNDLGKNNPCLLFEHFDIFYGVLDNISRVSTQYLFRSFDLLYHLLDNLGHHLSEHFVSSTKNDKERKQFLNLLKMNVFLITMHITDIDKMVYESVDLKQKSKKGNLSLQSVSEWDQRRNKAMIQIYNLLQLQLEMLWNPPVVEDRFTVLITDVCYATIEQNHSNAKSVNDTIFQILGTAIKRYNHAMSFPNRILEILRNCEHSVILISNGLLLLHEEYNLSTIFNVLLQEILDELDVDAADSKTSKHFGMFLSEFSEHAPKIIFPHLVEISDDLLNNQSHVLRNAVLKMLGDAIIQELTSEELSAEMKEIRDNFLEKLLGHAHDIHAFVRAKSLAIIHSLREANAIPLSFQQEVLNLAVGRLMDKTSTVRKSAIILIKTFLERNPFSSHLSVPELRKNYEVEMALQTELYEKITKIRNTISDAEQVFDDIIDKLSELLLQMRYEPCDDDAYRTALGENVNFEERVREFIKEEKYSDAIKMILFIDREAGNAEDIKQLPEDLFVTYFVGHLRSYVVGHDQLMEEQELATQLDKQEKLVKFTGDSINFCETITSALGKMEILLTSKTNTDVTETIDFFTSGYMFGIKGTERGMIKMLNLVWSTDKDKRDSVISAYYRVFFTTDKQGRAHAFQVVKNLSEFMNHISRGYYAAFEVLIKDWIEAEHIDQMMIQVMFEIFTEKIPSATIDDSRKALQILLIASKVKPTIVQANITVIEQYGIDKCKHSQIFVSTMSVLMNMVSATDPSKYYARIDETSNGTILKVKQAYLRMFFLPSIKDFDGVSASVLDFVYHVTLRPDIFVEGLMAAIFEGINANGLIKPLDSQELPPTLQSQDVMLRPSQAVTQRSMLQKQPASVPSFLVERFMHLIGYIAMMELIFLDNDLYNNAKYRKELKDEQQKSKKKDNPRHTMNSLNMSASNALKRLSGSNTTSQPNDGEENQGATADDRIAEMIQHILDKVILYTSESILSVFVLPLIELCKSPQKCQNEHVYQAVVLALMRFMSISSTYCESKIEFLMNILSHTSNNKIKVNIMIGLTDMMFRFPNVIGHWTKQFYVMLGDNDDHVRMSSVKMISYLIMNEMIRVKGQISNLVLCIVDKNPQIRETTEQFFKEISTKNNTLYNVLPDIISMMGESQIEEEKFRIAMKFIFDLVAKNRQVESLVDKLCLRFKSTTEERHWRDAVFCLGLLNHSEKTVRKMIDHIPCYKDKVQIDEVYNGFKQIINNIKKVKSQEMNEILLEFESKIDQCLSVNDVVRLQTNPDDGVESQSQPKEDDAQAGNQLVQTPRNTKKGTQMRGKQLPIKRPKRKQVLSDDSSDEDQQKSSSSESENSADDDEQNFKKPAPKSAPRKKPPNRRRK